MNDVDRAQMTATREEALALLEKVRAEYVASARDAALKLHLTTGLPITIDDVRKVCPPPEDIDGRVMGSILLPKQWQKTGYVSSGRRTCHKRPIGLFVFIGG